MKAVVIRAHGGVETLLYEEIETPEPGPGEVLVRIRASGINHLDHDVREGISGIPVTLPHVPGCEGVGEIAALGPGVDGPATRHPRRHRLRAGRSALRALAERARRRRLHPRPHRRGPVGDPRRVLRLPRALGDPAAGRPLLRDRRRRHDRARHRLAHDGRPRPRAGGADGAGQRGGQRGRLVGNPGRAAARRAGDRHGRFRRQAGEGARARRRRDHRLHAPEHPGRGAPAHPRARRRSRDRERGRRRAAPEHRRGLLQRPPRHLRGARWRGSAAQRDRALPQAHDHSRQPLLPAAASLRGSSR